MLIIFLFLYVHGINFRFILRVSKYQSITFMIRCQLITLANTPGRTSISRLVLNHFLHHRDSYGLNTWLPTFRNPLSTFIVKTLALSSLKEKVKSPSKLPPLKRSALYWRRSSSNACWTLSVSHVWALASFAMALVHVTIENYHALRENVNLHLVFLFLKKYNFLTNYFLVTYYVLHDIGSVVNKVKFMRIRRRVSIQNNI